MKKLFYLFLLLVVTKTGFSQTDFRKGYYITIANDTITGLINYREGANAYKLCDFRKTKTDNTTTYTPGEIAGYGFVDDKIFQSRTISSTDGSSRQVFLEIIVKGAVSLYKLENIFYAEKDIVLHELSNETEEMYVNEVLVLRNSNKHIAILNILLFDCAELRPKIQQARLDEKSLTNLIEKYNECKGLSATTFKSNKPWIRLLVGATGGLNMSKIEFMLPSNNHDFDHLRSPFETPSVPVFGLTFDILSPRVSERISFHGDVLYLNSTSYGFSIQEIPFRTTRHYVTIELSQLKFPISFRYTFPIKKITPYFDLGASGTLHLNSNSSWTRETQTIDFVETFNGEALEMKKNQVGYWGGIGVLKSVNKRLNAFVELRYEKTDGITENSINPQTLLRTKITNYQVLLGIKLK